ncbi:MAG: 4Fe-4S binding protein [Nitrospirae bacterium]|nr:4Fe-4S binding protein [Nitrospirota bacterium]
MGNIDRAYVRYLRYTMQWGIVLFLLYAGYHFFIFTDHFLSREALPAGGEEEVLKNRFPGVEGFLPIGALMGLKLWIMEGVFDRIHPAGLVIFVAAIVLAVVLKKGFCGWICPVGAFSDGVWKLGKKIFGRNFAIPRYADYGLRSVKYLLMAFFIYVIVLKMPAFVIFRFLENDYYKIADVKMLFFFTEMTRTTMISLSLLFVFSLGYKNFWCRYLCPYGALLGLLSILSPLKIRRNEQACIHCRKCTEHCPSLLPVETLSQVRSPECTGCLTCVSHCPAKGALDISLPARKAAHPLLFVCLIIVFFFGSITIAKLTDRWGSSVSYQDYQRIVPKSRQLDHP